MCGKKHAKRLCKRNIDEFQSATMAEQNERKREKNETRNKSSATAITTGRSIEKGQAYRNEEKKNQRQHND